MKKDLIERLEERRIRDLKTFEKGLEQLVPVAVGNKVIDLLQTRDEVSLADLIDSFEADMAARRDRGPDDLRAMQARVCITALRALRTTPESAPAGKSKA